MKLPPEAIKEYQKIYFAEFGKKLSEEQARDQASRTLTLLNFIFNTNENDKCRIIQK